MKTLQKKAALAALIFVVSLVSCTGGEPTQFGIGSCSGFIAKLVYHGHMNDGYDIWIDLGPGGTLERDKVKNPTEGNRMTVPKGDRTLLLDGRSAHYQHLRVIVFFRDIVLKGGDLTCTRVALMIAYSDPENPGRLLSPSTGESVELDDELWPVVLAKWKPNPERK